jgi:hypothetical protein
MVLPYIRYLLVVVASVTVGFIQAEEFPSFPEHLQYDALTVTSEVQVEALASAVAQTNNVDLSNAFEGFLTEYSADVAAHTLTVAGHNQRIDAFLGSINATLPDFYSTANAVIGAAEVDFFKFQLNVHAASWNVLDYGASTAQSQLGNAAVGDLLATLEAYMKENVATATGPELQAKSDEFFAQADTLQVGFQGAAYAEIRKLYLSLWNQQEFGGDSTANGQQEEGEAPGSGRGNNSQHQEDVDVGSSATSSSPSPTPTMTKDSSDGVPTPAPTSRASPLVPVSSITVAAITMAYTILLS